MDWWTSISLFKVNVGMGKEWFNIPGFIGDVPTVLLAPIDWFILVVTEWYPTN